MSKQRAYQRWCQQNPGFDWHGYRCWVEQHGYYRSALDVSKPDFYEYAAVYLRRAAEQGARIAR